MTVSSLISFRLAWVQTFGAVLECGSASAAARRIGCNQSTVSRSLKELGEFLGGDLFEGDNKLELTALGRAFIPEADKLMHWVRSCKGMNARLPPEASNAGSERARKTLRERVRGWWLG